MTRTVHSFVVVTGQRDNVGDSLLRRPLVSLARELGQCHVLVGKDATGYSVNVGLTNGDVVYADRRRWLKALVASALSTRTHLILNAGEMTINRKYALDRIVLFPVIALLKLRRGLVVQTGVGIRNPRARVPRLIRMIVGSADIVTWRDGDSREAARHGAVQPDWAFAEGSSAAEIKRRYSTPRTSRLALSLRGDRQAPSKIWIDTLKTALQAHSVRPVVVCQVRRDEDRSRWLADQLDADYVPWGPLADHRQQEEIARGVYADCDWVISDRLHVLIAAATEGAVVVPFAPDSGAKLKRTLGAAGMTYLEVDALDLSDDALDRERDALLSVLEDTRDQLVRLVRRVRMSATSKSSRTARIRVLHSMPGPVGDTRYSSHMAAVESEQVGIEFFSWPRALLGRYDAFHLHWPEHLVGTGSGWRQKARTVLTRLLIMKLKLQRVPVVRTLHNLVPHDSRMSPTLRSISEQFEALTVQEVHLVEEPGRRTTASTTLIPHGSYREPFGGLGRSEVVPGRVTYFGLLKKYKGIESLLAAFATLSDDALSLRVVGKPVDPDLKAAITRASSDDGRMSARFAFVTDRELVEEVSASELIVLPYEEMHSSGSVLVALSLDRHVLIPDSPTGRALQQEAGSNWVSLYSGVLSGSDIEAALMLARRNEAGSRPDLSDREWTLVRERHRAVYFDALGRTDVSTGAEG